ncbi:response regulator [Pantanalinema rosaneae CENA516]|uniref:response regulator n=1 Tax=Pantanalinema rosaneae TaxID=1620701 RepID=UPI003D6E27B6
MTKSILLIDDDQDIRDVVQLALQKFTQWQVSVAASGQEGLEYAKRQGFDAILLDISMPDMDGFSVFECLQSDPRTQAIPVILLTAKVLPSDRRRFAEMRVSGVISKPFNPISVGNQVAQLLHW